MSKKISLPVIGAQEGENSASDTSSGERSIGEEIQEEVGNNEVVLYMKGSPDQPMCGFSQRAVQVLNALGKPFYAVDILADSLKRQGIKDFSNWPTIPQIYYKGEFLGGCDLLMEMYQSGELQALFAK
jgi:monothiol glutaredoxin